MASKYVAHGLRVPSAERRHHEFVLFDGIFPFLAVLIGAKTQGLQTRIDLVVGCGQNRVFGGLVDGVVDRRIEPVIAGQVATGVSPEHFVMHRLDFEQLRIGDAPGSQFA